MMRSELDELRFPVPMELTVMLFLECGSWLDHESRTVGTWSDTLDAELEGKALR